MDNNYPSIPPETKILHDSKDMDGSIPCSSTSIVENSPQKRANQSFENLVWQHSVAAMDDTEHKPTKYPHKRARLIHHDYDLSKRWYVVFYAWDIHQEKLVRKRLFEPINREKTVHKRLDEAEHIIRQVNKALNENKVLGTEKDIVQNERKDVSKLTVLQAIDYVKSQKELTGHRKYYVDTFQRLKTNLGLWLEYEGRPDYLVKHFTRDDSYSFFEFLKSDRKVANKTHNNYRTDLITVFNFLMKRNLKLFAENPATTVDKLPVISRKHAALSEVQMEKVKEQCVLGNLPSMLLFIQMIYYTFGRPREIVRLKIENVDFLNNRILFPAHISKGRTDEYVGITPALREKLLALNLDQYPPEFYLFGHKSKPGPKAMDYTYFYRKNTIIFKRLGFDKASVNHSVYSYKHSGVIALYLATKDIILCQHQCRHKSVNQTMIYLRDLGAFSDYDGLQKWTSSI
jgi:integrase